MYWECINALYEESNSISYSLRARCGRFFSSFPLDLFSCRLRKREKKTGTASIGSSRCRLVWLKIQTRKTFQRKKKHLDLLIFSVCIPWFCPIRFDTSVLIGSALVFLMIFRCLFFIIYPLALFSLFCLIVFLFPARNSRVLEKKNFGVIFWPDP